MAHTDKCITLLLQLREERVYFSLRFQNTRVHNCVKAWHSEQEAERSHLPLKTRSGEQTGSGVRLRAKCVLPPARLQHPAPKSITNRGLNVQMPEPTGAAGGRGRGGLIHATTTTGPCIHHYAFLLHHSLLTVGAPAPVVFNL